MRMQDQAQGQASRCRWSTYQAGSGLRRNTYVRHGGHPRTLARHYCRQNVMERREEILSTKCAIDTKGLSEPGSVVPFTQWRHLFEMATAAMSAVQQRQGMYKLRFHAESGHEVGTSAINDQGLRLQWAATVVSGMQAPPMLRARPSATQHQQCWNFFLFSVELGKGNLSPLLCGHAPGKCDLTRQQGGPCVAALAAHSDSDRI